MYFPAISADRVLRTGDMLARIRSKLPEVLIRKNVIAVSREDVHLMVNRVAECADC